MEKKAKEKDSVCHVIKYYFNFDSQESKDVMLTKKTFRTILASSLALVNV